MIKKDVHLAPLSTFNIGGRAEYVCTVQNSADFFRALNWLRWKNLPYRIFASASNIVFPDADIRKEALIKFEGGNLRIKKSAAIADSGVLLSDIVQASVKAGLSGLETLSGIPGTLGGAVVGNAGAYGHSISEVVDKIEVFDGKRTFWLKNSGCRFGYRHSIFKEKPLVILSAILRFSRGKPQELKKTSKEIIEIRLKKYKPKLKCPGSFFKNVLVKDVPKRTLKLLDQSKIIDGKIPTGYLLELVRAKGMQVGGLEVANFHGNLFINKGDATAKDVKRLAKLLKNRVNNKFGIELEEEIRYF